MILKDLNSANNIKIAEAKAFVDKLRALGIPAGELRLNGMVEGGGVADFVPVDSVETNPDEAYSCLVFINGDFHNVANMKRMLGAGTLVEFKRVAEDCSLDGDTAALNIPGAAKAIEKIIQKA